MPLSAARIRRSKRQNEKSFVVYHNILGAQAAERLIKRVFGPTSVYITYSELMRRGDTYLKQILGIEKIA